ncbi:peptidoglycan-binding domain-containing protein [uncultured Mobiluncus sp.]|uniref:peptidoglycan-binding domain-containing protein n=1 Tax=uncultured Mobiluncus sp. TaxID=293425 RepID=UPI002805C3AC|nr:peptidoglycan-binding domain-containing protein [uncultured Mobiluncus sp.]
MIQDNSETTHNLTDSKLAALGRLRAKFQDNSLAWILSAVIILLTLLLVISLVALFVRSPNEAAIENSRITPVVTAKVEKKTFDLTPVEIEGTASTGASENVAATGTVTALNVAGGDTVNSGQVVGRVDGNPVIVLNMPFKLYRDINTGDAGDDVREVQRALQALGLYHGRVDGSYGWTTSQAVNLLYSRNAIRPPQAAVPVAPAESGETTDAPAPAQPAPPALTPVLKAEIMAMGAPQATVTAVAPIGTVLSDTQPLATLKLGNPSVTLRVNISESSSFPVGQEVEITDPAQGKVVARGSVSTVGEFSTNPTAGSSDVKPGYDVSVNVTHNNGLTDGAKVMVSPAGAQGNKTAIAIPATALREIGGKTFVAVAGTKIKGDRQDRKQVEVHVDQVVDGWALLAEKPAPALKPGQTVIVAVPR